MLVGLLQAVNKLAEVMNRKELSTKQGKKVNVLELRKVEKICRKLEAELNIERQKFNTILEKMQRDLSEAQANLLEESQKSQRLQMDLDSKESEMEHLLQKMTIQNSDTMSVNSGDQDGDDVGLTGTQPYSVLCMIRV